MTCSAPRMQEVHDDADDSASASLSNVVCRRLIRSDAVVDVVIDSPEPLPARLCALRVLVDCFDDLRTFREEEAADPAVLLRALELRDSIADPLLRD